MRFSDLSALALVSEQETKDMVIKKVDGKNPKTGEPTSFDIRRGDIVAKKNVTMYVINDDTTHYIEAPVEKVIVA